MRHGIPLPDPRIPDDDSILACLVTATGRKDRVAFSKLYRCIASKIYGVAYSILASRQDAEEAVADTFMHVWSRAHQYDRRRGPVLAWITIITRSNAIDRLRRRRPHLSLSDQRWQGWLESRCDEFLDPDAAVSRAEDHRSVGAALASLPPLRRKLVDLAFFEGLSHAEMSEVLDMPCGTVKSHIRRALIAMRVGMKQSETAGHGPRHHRR